MNIAGPGDEPPQPGEEEPPAEATVLRILGCGMLTPAATRGFVEQVINETGKVPG
jgi:hypothetical protein